ncbi:hypothetical protein [Stenotrophomonas sp.]|uniref:hypothetical protein n=1 Tax=Stenotrophomonas sp. TaxID=69392 RepID=UPI0028A2033D|nr:hypothetical protein [Stenotrophomonas sp.]
MNKWIKRVVAFGFLSMSCFGGIASAAQCERPCFYAYQRCLSVELDKNACFEAYLACVDISCGGNP